MTSHGCMLLCLAFITFVRLSACSKIWNHPMHNVYPDSTRDDQTSPAGGYQGKFLSLSRDELIRMKRALRRVPYKNTPLELVYNAAVLAEKGYDVELSMDDIFPNPDEAILDMMDEDEGFTKVVQDYLERDSGPGRVVTLQADIPAPEDRKQTQGFSGCVADYDAYIGPLTRRWLWDKLTLNGSDPLPRRPPGPAEEYSFLLDATGRRPTGLFEGNFHWLGSLRECVTTIVQHEVRVDEKEENRTFKGRYARLDIPIIIDDVDNSTVNYALGVCVPDTCNKEDVRAYITGNFEHNDTLRNDKVNTILAKLFSNWPIKDVYMGQETDWDNDIPAKAALGILLAGVIIMVISTCYDGWGRHRIIRKNIKKQGSGTDDKKPLTNDDLLKAKEYLYEAPGMLDKLEVALSGYSIYSNVRNIFTTTPRYGRYHIPALDGLRAITVIWIIYGMTYVYGILYFECWTNANLISAFDHFLQEFSIMPILQSWYANSTMFFISGFVCVQMWYRHWKRANKRITVAMLIKWIVARYLSIMPAMMGMLMIYTCLTPYISDGPMQPRKISDATNCRNTWWITMLLFHNLFRTEEQCFGWSWMFGAVWQLNLASIFIIIPLVILPIAGYVLIALMYIAHITILTIWNQQSLTGEKSWYWDILQTPWCNAGPYCIGMVLAIIMKKGHGKKAHMSWPLVLVFWICASVFLGTVVYAPWDHIKPDSDDWTDTGHVAFDTLAPQMLALSVAWITWACYNDYGGVVGSILNWKFFTVLSKLALPTTIFMGPAMLAYFYGRERLFYIAESHMNYLYHAQLVTMLISALMVAISFQHPIGRSMMIQVTAITRLELLLHSRHPLILNQLTGDPKEDAPFWQKLEKKKEEKIDIVTSAPAILLKGGKPIGGFTPCQDSISGVDELSYPVVVAASLSNGLDGTKSDEGGCETLKSGPQYVTNKVTPSYNKAFVRDDDMTSL